MNIIFLTSFYYLVSLESISKAAEKLGYSQSTVSYHIKSLQDNYGILYFKKGGRVHLTETGYLVFEFIEEFLEKEEQLHKKIFKTNSTLRVGTISSILEFVLTGKINNFRRRNPHLKVEIVLKEEAELFNMLLSNQLDCIYIFDKKIEISRDYFVHKQEMSFDLISKGSSNFTQREEYRMILTDKKCTYRAAFLKEFPDKDKVTVSLELESPKEIIRLLNPINELAFLPKYVTRNLSKEEFNRQEVTLDTIFYLQFIYGKKNVLAADFFETSILNSQKI
ncbi:LysR family transcriptional regulator [Enterococcus sp. LJL120]